MLATGKKIPIVRKATIFVIVGSGVIALAGCVLLPLVQAPAQPASVSTPQASATPTLIKETATVTVVPSSITPSPTATGTPVSSLPPPDASTMFEEPFSDNRNNWHTDSTLARIVEEKYSHQIDCPETNVSPQCGTFIKIPFTFPRNFRMEIDATVTKASSEASIHVAFEVRRKAEYYYIDYSITDSHYQLSRISQYGIFEILPETVTEFVKTALGDTNRLGIEVKDTVLTPLVNGHELSPAHDGKIPNAGDSYLVLLIARGGSAELQFDNLTVQEVK